MDCITKYRIRKLKAMHEMMLNIDEEEYKHVEEVFKRLIVKAIKNDEF